MTDEISIVIIIEYLQVYYNGQYNCLFNHTTLGVSTALKSERKRNIEVSEEDVLAFDTAFASRLKSLRDERGLKRDWVARQLGVHYNTLKNWELGKSHPGTRDLLALGQIYHMPPTDFLKIQ